MKIEIKKTCGICNNGDLKSVLDLGKSPIANKFCSKANMSVDFFDLILDFCDKCFNLQLRHRIDASYLYDHSYSYATPIAKSLDNHYENTISKLTELEAISSTSSVLEIGSNNGNFLAVARKHVKKVLGVDPARNITTIANSRGIPTVNDFFTEDVAQTIVTEFGVIDLVAARHMFAHNTAPSEMIKGVKKCLAKGGTLLIENAYAIETLLQGEFDQVYHEHMYYYSASSMNKLMQINGLELYDVYFSNVHGGSASFFISKPGEREKSITLIECLKREKELFTKSNSFAKFRSKMKKLKVQVNNFVENCKKNNEKMAIYSVPNKLFTFLTATEFPLQDIEFMVDTSHEKIGKYYPNTDIKIISEAELITKNCEVFFVGAWNYKREIIDKAPTLFRPGTKLVFALPFFDIVVV